MKKFKYIPFYKAHEGLIPEHIYDVPFYKKVDVKEFEEVVSAKEKVDSQKEVKETKKAEKDETADKKL